MAEVLNAVLGFAILGGLLVSPYFIIKWLRAVRRTEYREKHAQAPRDGAQMTKARVAGKPERAFLKACTNCSDFALTLPYRDTLSRTYCSEVCMKLMGERPMEFCKKCMFETTPQSSGNLQRINGIGTAFVGSSERCGECASVIRRVWFTIFYFPVIPLQRYRIIQLSPRQFLSRRAP